MKQLKIHVTWLRKRNVKYMSFDLFQEEIDSVEGGDLCVSSDEGVNYAEFDVNQVADYSRMIEDVLDILLRLGRAI